MLITIFSLVYFILENFYFYFISTLQGLFVIILFYIRKKALFSKRKIFLVLILLVGNKIFKKTYYRNMVNSVSILLTLSLFLCILITFIYSKFLNFVHSISKVHIISVFIVDKIVRYERVDNYVTVVQIMTVFLLYADMA